MLVKSTIVAIVAAVMFVSLPVDAGTIYKNSDYRFKEPTARRHSETLKRASDHSSRIPGRFHSGDDEIVNGVDVNPAFKYPFMAAIFDDYQWKKSRVSVIDMKRRLSARSRYSHRQVSSEEESTEDFFDSESEASSFENSEATSFENSEESVAANQFSDTMCGGTFISPNLVLTAAHCTVGMRPNNVKVQWHRHNLHTSRESESGLQFSVKKLMHHPKYTSAEHGFDVAIWVLDVPTTEAEIKAFETPSLLTSYLDSFKDPSMHVSLDDGSIVHQEGLELTVAGWGAHTQGHGTGNLKNNILQEVNVPIADQKQCAKNYNREDFSTMFCAGYEEGGKDSCQGDSGGPIFYTDPKTNRKTIVGVVSWGYGCAAARYYGIYSEVGALRGWLDQTISEYSL